MLKRFATIGTGVPAAVRLALAGAMLALAASPAVAQLAAPLRQAVDAVFAQYDRPDSPGCALSMMQDGRIVYARGYGLANLEHAVPIVPSSVFHVASVSKQFAATAITMLAHQGRLSLDDDVRAHLPELHDFGPTITVRHLLHHTSGLRDQWTLFSMAGWRGLDLKTDEDVLMLAERQRELNFEPGAEHLYSNTGYTLLGEIVRRVTGQSLREWTSEHLFGPLGMTRTHFHDDFNMVVPGRTHGYAPAAGGFRISNPAYATVGATSLFTTVEDLALWDRNFDERRVGGAAIDSLHTRGRLNDGSAIPYAFALTHGQHRGLATVGHGGSDAGYRSQFVRYPDQGFSMAVLCNVSTANPGALARGVAEAYLAESFPQPAPAAAGPQGRGGGGGGGGGRGGGPPAPTLSVQQLQGYQGDYYSFELNATYTVALVGDRLMVRRWRYADQALQPTGAETFSGPGGTYRFERDGAGRVTTFRITAGRVRDLRFERRDR